MMFLEIPRDRKWNGSCLGLGEGGATRNWSFTETEVWFIRWRGLGQLLVVVLCGSVGVLNAMEPAL